MPHHLVCAPSENCCADEVTPSMGRTHPKESWANQLLFSENLELGHRDSRTAEGPGRYTNVSLESQECWDRPCTHSSFCREEYEADRAREIGPAAPDRTEALPSFLITFPFFNLALHPSGRGLNFCVSVI